MQWIANNTPDDSRFIVLSRGQLLEWTPQLARRTVLNLRFGSEWVPDQAERIERFRREVSACDDLGCVRSLVSEHFDYEGFYLYVDRGRFAELANAASCGPRTYAAGFEVLFENAEATVARAVHPTTEQSIEGCTS